MCGGETLDLAKAHAVDEFWALTASLAGRRSAAKGVGVPRRRAPTARLGRWCRAPVAAGARGTRGSACAAAALAGTARRYAWAAFPRQAEGRR